MALLTHSLLGIEGTRASHPCSSSCGSLYKLYVPRVSTSETLVSRYVVRRSRKDSRIRCGISGPCSGDILEPKRPSPSVELNEKDVNTSSRDSVKGWTSAPRDDEESDNSRDSLEGGKMRLETTPWKNVFPAYMQSKEDEGVTQESGNESVGNSPSVRGAVNGVVAAKAAAAATASAKEFESQFRTRSSPLLKSQGTATSTGKNLEELITDDPIWAAIRAEARLEAEREPLLSSFLYASILAHSCFERSLGFVLANRLKNATLLATQLLDIFDDVFQNDAYVVQAIRLDVQAVKDRDPSCKSYSSALLYLKVGNSKH